MSLCVCVCVYMYAYVHAYIHRETMGLEGGVSLFGVEGLNYGGGGEI